MSLVMAPSGDCSPNKDQPTAYSSGTLAIAVAALLLKMKLVIMTELVCFTCAFESKCHSAVF